ncbi:transposase [Streptomyces sp. NPDC001220]
MAGAPRGDRRRCLEFQTGAQWVQPPAKYGSWRGVYDRLRMWSADGTWEQVFTTLLAQADADEELNWVVSGVCPQFRESPGQGGERGIVSAEYVPAWQARRSRLCCFPGSMCEWSASATPPMSSWWRPCPPLARAGAQTAGNRRGACIARINEPWMKGRWGRAES